MLIENLEKQVATRGYFIVSSEECRITLVDGGYKGDTPTLRIQISKEEEGKWTSLKSPRIPLGELEEILGADLHEYHSFWLDHESEMYGSLANHRMFVEGRVAGELTTWEHEGKSAIGFHRWDLEGTVSVPSGRVRRFSSF